MILIAGLPKTRPVMDAVADALAADGKSVLVAEHLDSIDPATLEMVTVLVSVAYPCTATEMDRLPQLRGIVSPAIGYEWIDIAEATRRGIAVVNGDVPENRESMAEATVLMLLALLYRLPATEAALRIGSGPLTSGRRMLKGRTIGVIGHGGIARGFIERLSAWQCRFLVYSRSQAGEGATDYVPLEQLLRESDIVVLLTSLDPDTRRLLDRDRLAMMKPDALLVNTARGGLVDEAALVEALRDGRIGGAALDVFEVEPLPEDSPLRSLPNLILTGHSIGHTQDSFQAIPRQAARNTADLLASRLPESCQNREIAETWSNTRVPAGTPQ